MKPNRKKIRNILNVAEDDKLPVPIFFDGATREMYAVAVSGESLTGVGIESGDFVIMDATKRKIHDCVGEIVHARVDGKNTVKRLGISGNGYVLMPENPAYGQYCVKPNEKLKIIGVAIAVQKRLYKAPF